jgi:hypothetical protein
MCLQCFIFKNNQNGCIQCAVKAEEEDDEVDEERPIKNDDFSDFDQDQLFDDWDDSKQTDMDLMNSIYDDETEENDSDDDDNSVAQNQVPYKVQWLSDIKDDAAEFSSDHIYPHTKSMLEIFGNVFGLKQVKINCLLSFKEDFILNFSFVQIN